MIHSPIKQLLLKDAALADEPLMRLLILKVFLLVILIASAVFTADGQTCTGSLGDPVINETFGAGTAPGIGPPLPGAATNYIYSNTCPADGTYNIASSLTGVLNCHSDTWHNVPKDHTGDPNGYMMIVNASYQPGIFYTQVAKGDKLCPNTTYEFAAFIANLIIPEAQTDGYIKPNITFTITDSKGNALAKPYTTGDIDAVKGDTVKWKHYGMFFTTPSDGSDIIVTMTNNAPGGLGNDLILDDITFRPCGPVIQSRFGSAIGDAGRNLCEGESAVYTLKASQQGYNDPKYQWQVNKDGEGWTDIVGENSTLLVLDKTFINAVAGTYQYRMGILEGNATSAACSIFSQPLTVQVNALPVINLSPLTAACEGQPLLLHAEGGDKYEWSGPGNFTSSAQDPLVTTSTTPAAAGTYTVKVISKEGCPKFASTAVNVSPAIIPGISNDPAPLCEGEATRLLATGGLHYKWKPSTGLDHDDIPSPVATPLQTTTYKVLISNEGCVDSSKTVTVNVRKNPIANAGSRKTIFEGESVKLDGAIGGDNISRFYWTPSQYLDNPLSLTPTASPVSNITYTLNVTSETCGSTSSSVFVRVYEKLGIPNTFTPNGDGRNDLWNISKLTTYPGCTVLVYSRAGQQVFKSTGYSKPWDGSYNGSALPTGTYYYIIDLKIGTPKISGWVLIAR